MHFTDIWWYKWGLFCPELSHDVFMMTDRQRWLSVVLHFKAVPGPRVRSVCHLQSTRECLYQSRISSCNSNESRFDTQITQHCNVASGTCIRVTGYHGEGADYKLRLTGFCIKLPVKAREMCSYLHQSLWPSYPSGLWGLKCDWGRMKMWSSCSSYICIGH